MGDRRILGLKHCHRRIYPPSFVYCPVSTAVTLMPLSCALSLQLSVRSATLFLAFPYRGDLGECLIDEGEVRVDEKERPLKGELVHGVV